MVKIEEILRFEENPEESGNRIKIRKKYHHIIFDK